MNDGDTAPRRESVLLTQADGVASLSIDNPRRRNCLSLTVLEDLGAALGQLASDGSCRSVVFTGSDGYFCAGGDVAAMASLSAEEAVERLALMHEVVLALVALPVPVVAAVQGGAAGGGLSLAAACDVVVVEDDAKLVLGFDRVGLVPDLGALYFFERRMGAAATRRLVYLLSALSAREAVDIGLMDVVVATTHAPTRAHEIAAQIAARSPLANELTKSMLAASPRSLADTLTDEFRHAARLYASPNYLAATGRSGQV